MLASFFLVASCIRIRVRIRIRIRVRIRVRIRITTTITIGVPFFVGRFTRTALETVVGHQELGIVLLRSGRRRRRRTNQAVVPSGRCVDADVRVVGVGVGVARCGCFLAGGSLGLGDLLQLFFGLLLEVIPAPLFSLPVEPRKTGGKESSSVDAIVSTCTRRDAIATGRSRWLSSFVLFSLLLLLLLCCRCCRWSRSIVSGTL
mmetsp:Transcript_3554/g.7284  ORF Transcript_3554/g.7284 Transcript_3554/m.7284 type:complete len:203 (+) Transcript_3554:1318-1926(+)